MRLASASSLLNAVTSENMGQATPLRNMGDVWNVGRVNDEVKWKLKIGESPPLPHKNPSINEDLSHFCLNSASNGISSRF